jgi:cobalt-precorrin-5B (C1)-methyltransferase
VQITLPKGETPVFKIAHREVTRDWVEIGITKDAGDDPDVTHGALIIAKVARSSGGVRFHAGEGVGTITKAGLPIAVGEPAINPVPRQMMQAEVEDLALRYGQAPDVDITIRIPGGRALALKTWNPRLGIVDGLSVLGTTGIVRPFFVRLPGLPLFTAALMWRGRAERHMWLVAQVPPPNVRCRRCMVYPIHRCWTWEILPVG